MSEGWNSAENRQRTKPEYVLAILREEILSQALPGGSTLRQEDVASRLHVSRIPVREAFRQLETEGLVSVTAHRGTVVAEISPAAFEEITEMLLLLEPWALGLSVQRIGEGDLGRAADLLARHDGESMANTTNELNVAFHLTIYAAANRPYLLSTIRSLYRAQERYLRISLMVRGVQRDSEAEHRAILSACKDRDVVTATSLLRAHVQGEAEKVLASLQTWSPRKP